MSSKRISIVGYGYLGQAYHKMFPDAFVYDEPKNYYWEPGCDGQGTAWAVGDHVEERREEARREVNKADMAIVAVPTDLISDSNKESFGQLDMSIIEGVMEWLDTPLILIKSALYPGTADRLIEKTGKNIAVGVELIGMGSYYSPPHKYPDPRDPQKHNMIIVGGDQDVASQCAEILWSRMSPDVKIHLVSALEAEITKLVENSYPAMKVTFINSLMTLAQRSGANFIRIHQAWQSDGRVDGFHQRAVTYNRGWKSHCFDKDIPALVTYAQEMGASDMAQLFQAVLDINKDHLELNEDNQVK
jgi:UDP-glucose 6-dehydrogenase